MSIISNKIRKSMKNYKFIIKGKVQGVYYRKTIYENSTLVNFNGYVKNLSDGSVEACISVKDEIELKQFKTILKKGSMSSKVESIEKFEIEEKYENGFSIQY
jgi:acylphosphatase